MKKISIASISNWIYWSFRFTFLHWDAVLQRRVKPKGFLDENDNRKLKVLIPSVHYKFLVSKI